MRVGIESLNICAGSAFIDTPTLARHRGADPTRAKYLLMQEKTVIMPFEDPVTFAVNAATPLIERLSPQQRDKIDLVITCTESSLDFGKSLSTYVHRELGLKKNCRLIELKQACYSGVAGLQMAANYILSNVNPGAKALVVATDISRFSPLAGSGEQWWMAELVAGSGAVAMIVGDDPAVFELDIGASGYYGYEVMDTCRPFADGGGTGDSDLSLMSYLDCLDAAYANYASRVEGVDLRTSFQYLVFHSPFGGMVKGAHKRLMRNQCRASPRDIDADFERRVEPGLQYAARMGNLLGGSTLLGLASTIENARFDGPQRIGCYSYGSGCCAEFFSGIITNQSQAALAPFEIQKRINDRYYLKPAEYDNSLAAENVIGFGVRSAVPRMDIAPAAVQARDHKQLCLQEIRDFQRRYAWV